MARELDDWISSFEEYSTKTTSPKIFRRWTAISLVGAVLERKAWVETAVRPIYPNLYIFLVSPPAIGKGVMAGEAYSLVSELKEQKLCSSSPTRATIIEELDNAKRYVTTANQAISFNALYVISNELGVFLPAYEIEFLSKLTDIYDGVPYSETRRDKRHTVNIPKPLFNILACTQPGYLTSMLPEIAWEQGFLSRVNMIYSGQKEIRSIWDKREISTIFYNKIVNGLKTIANLRGNFKFTDEAANAIDAFHGKLHEDTDLQHPKMHHYNARRWFHLIKLMMISSASRSDAMQVETQDYQRALAWLVEGETTVSELFKAMTTGGDSQIIREAWYFLYEQYTKTEQGIDEKALISWLAKRVPSEKVQHILDLMVASGIVEAEGVKGVKRMIYPGKGGV